MNPMTTIARDILGLYGQQKKAQPGKSGIQVTKQGEALDKPLIIWAS